MSKRAKERFESLGGRMKVYEHQTAMDKLIPNLPVIIRLDGRKFSKFTRGLERPFDERMMKAMQDTTQYLLDRFPSAYVGYTQSDEISIVLRNDYTAPCEFDGRIQKLASIFSSECSVQFYINCLKYGIPLEGKNNPVFDCRVFNVPDLTEASNCILWREEDARVNSIQSVGHHYMTQKEMNKLSSKEVIDRLNMFYQVDWKSLLVEQKYGTYLFRKNRDVKQLNKALKEYSLEERLEFLFGSYERLN